jgi:DNA (cytosine-5)-methyltransferase 1
MTHGSLFSGIGGFDLAAEWMEWENLFHCEINEFGRLVLKYYWPNAKSYEDIKATDFTVWRGLIDIISGGFPCQPYSNAGKRKGKKDDRHLWPEMLRAIREIQPSYVVGENVRGLTNWNGGMVFDEVQANLEAEGYEVLPFLLPACGVGAPHRRDRIWFVAYAPRITKRKQANQVESFSEERPARIEFGGTGGGEIIANTNSNERSKRRLYQERPQTAAGYTGPRHSRYDWGDWKDFPTKPPLCSRNDGVSRRMAGITVSKWRKQSIEALGNAIVPQVAFQIFKAIEQFQKNNTV